jgi:2-polyprenyl-3-methyl-5-hydroxy-6-metoxy-1,4-benzoquinol methylase
MKLPLDANGLIDVKALIELYDIGELNAAADEYYQDYEDKKIATKPFSLPSTQHLLAEFAHMVSGLNLTPGDRILDFGCGTGWSSRILHSCGCEVVGVDVSARAVEIATKLTNEWRKYFDKFGDTNGNIKFKRYDG